MSFLFFLDLISLVFVTRCWVTSAVYIAKERPIPPFYEVIIRGLHMSHGPTGYEVDQHWIWSHLMGRWLRPCHGLVRWAKKLFVFTLSFVLAMSFFFSHSGLGSLSDYLIRWEFMLSSWSAPFGVWGSNIIFFTNIYQLTGITEIAFIEDPHFGMLVEQAGEVDSYLLFSEHEIHFWEFVIKSRRCDGDSVSVRNFSDPSHNCWVGVFCSILTSFHGFDGGECEAYRSTRKAPGPPTWEAAWPPSGSCLLELLASAVGFVVALLVGVYSQWSVVQS